MQWPLGGMAIILGVLALVLAFIATEWRQDRVSALMFLPYAAWLTLASAVNAGVVLMN
jgi:tryptophan-rich sensory protein